MMRTLHATATRGKTTTVEKWRGVRVKRRNACIARQPECQACCLSELVGNGVSF
jgi:endonuclease III